MSTRSLYRRHSPQFKWPLCADIRNGKIGRREAKRTYQILANLIQLWLSQYDRGELNVEEAAATTISEYGAQIAAFERKVGPLTMEIDLLKKNATAATRKQQRALIYHQRPTACGVQRGCQMIQLPRSTFYDRAGTPSSPCLSDARLLERIGCIQDALSGDGYRRVTCALQAQGYGIHHRRVARIMRQPGLGIQPKRRFVRTTDRQHDGPVFPNLHRNRIPDRPDQIWVADMTFIRIERGVVYLAVILDACSRKVIGYALGRQIDTQLTWAALKAAGIQRRPVPGTCIHHSDRGCQ